MLDGILDESYSINYIKTVRRRTARTERNEKIANKEYYNIYIYIMIEFAKWLKLILT